MKIHPVSKTDFYGTKKPTNLNKSIKSTTGKAIGALLTSIITPFTMTVTSGIIANPSFDDDDNDDIFEKEPYIDNEQESIS